MSSSWGKPPWEIKQKLEEGVITIAECMEAVTLESFKSFAPENIYTFLDMEGHLKEEDRKNKLKEYNQMLNMVKDKEQRKVILMKIEELSDNG